MDKEKFNIELNGIIGTILSYSKNPYIVGYTNSLRKYINNYNEEMLVIILRKLVSWYDENISKILTNDYISNKNDHLYTKELVCDFLLLLENNKST